MMACMGYKFQIGQKVMCTKDNSINGEIIARRIAPSSIIHYIYSFKNNENGGVYEYSEWDLERGVL